MIGRLRRAAKLAVLGSVLLAAGTTYGGTKKHPKATPSPDSQAESRKWEERRKDIERIERILVLRLNPPTGLPGVRPLWTGPPQEVVAGDPAFGCIEFNDWRAAFDLAAQRDTDSLINMFFPDELRLRCLKLQPGARFLLLAETTDGTHTVKIALDPKGRSSHMDLWTSRDLFVPVPSGTTPPPTESTPLAK